MYEQYAYVIPEGNVWSHLACLKKSQLPRSYNLATFPMSP